MAISEAETSTAPVLLKESDIPEASPAGRKPAELGKATLLFWQLFKRDRESTARKTTVCLHRMIRIVLQLLQLQLMFFFFSLSFRQTAVILF